jgi:stage V sporulation protein D (sporulation-specific penicillin-binding protein)
MGFEPQYNEQELQTVDRSVPELTGMTAAEAGTKAEGAGFTYRVIGTGATVTAQLPAANSVVAAGSQIILYCDAEPSAQLETMPDLTDLSYSVARQKLGGYALYIRASGPITDPATVVVVSQNVAAGTALEHGTIVEVTVADKSDLGRY